MQGDRIMTGSVYGSTAKRGGLVANIERYALNDGLGVRTTVFLKGCPLRCRWCCNPETQSNKKEFMFFADNCIACGACMRNCPFGTDVIRKMKQAAEVFGR